MSWIVHVFALALFWGDPGLESLVRSIYLPADAEPAARELLSQETDEVMLAISSLKDPDRPRRLLTWNLFDTFLGRWYIPRHLYDRIPPLAVLARTGRADYVEAMLARGAAIDAPDERGRTPLAHAVDRSGPYDRGGTAAIMLLLERGADPNRDDATGMTPLLAALSGQPDDVIEAMITRGGDFGRVTARGETALMRAATGSLRAGNLAFDAGVPIDARDSLGRTALMHVFDGPLTYSQAEPANTLSEEHLPARIVFFLDRGADPNARDESGFSPLLHAIRIGCEESILPLLDRGADPNLRDAEGRSPVAWAVREKRYIAAALLVSRGARVTPDDRWDGTGLEAELAKPDADLFRLVLERSLRLDEVETMHLYALKIAYLLGREDLITLLRGKGITPQGTQGRFGQSFLSLAEHEKYWFTKKLVKRLLRDGAHLTIRGDRGDDGDPENTRVSRIYTEAARELHDEGCDLQALLESALGERPTPIFWAIHLGDPELVRLLLPRAHVTRKEDRDMLLYSAITVGEPVTVERMLAFGAQPSSQGLAKSLKLKGADVFQRLVAALDGSSRRQHELDYALREVVRELGTREISLLLEAGASAERMLPVLAEYGNRNLDKRGAAKILFDRGASLEVTDDSKRTSLVIAVESDRIDLALRLLDLGANPRAKTRKGITILDAAREKRKECHVSLTKLDPRDVDRKRHFEARIADLDRIIPRLER